MMSRKLGLPRPPCVSRAPPLTPAPVFEADATSRLHEESWNNISSEAVVNAAAHQCEQHLHEAYANAPRAKLVIRPLVAQSGALESPYMLSNGRRLHENLMAHASDFARAYRQAGLSRQCASSPPDPDMDWSPPRAQVAAAANLPPRGAGPLSAGGGPHACALPHEVYDTLPHDVVEQPPAPHAPVGGGATPATDAAAAGTLLQSRAALMATARPAPLSGQRRPSYGQRVLLQRVVVPPDGDFPYPRDLPYVNACAADHQEDSSAHPVERAQLHDRRHYPYGTYQDAVQRGPYIVQRAATAPHVVFRGPGIAAMYGTGPVRPTGHGAAEFAAPKAVQTDGMDEWTSEAPAAPDARARAGSRGMQLVLPLRPPTPAEAMVMAAAMVKREVEPPSAAGGCGGQEGCALWNLEALADAACWAAELLDREKDEEVANTAEVAPASVDSGGGGGGGGSSRRSRDAEERSRGGGRRRAPPQAAPAAAAAVEPGSAAAPSLPLTVFHTDRKCPKVMAPRSGRLGDTKHLVLPAEILQALPQDVSCGERSLRVQALIPPLAPAANNLLGPQQQQHPGLQGLCKRYHKCDMECPIGNGPGGFPALHVPVSQAVYGRPVRRFTLRADMVLELELGEAVTRPSRGGRRGVEEEEEERDEDDRDGAAAAAAGGDNGAEAATAAGVASPREVSSQPAGVRDRMGNGDVAGEVDVARGRKEAGGNGGAGKVPGGCGRSSGEDEAAPHTPEVLGAAEAMGATRTDAAVGTVSGSNVSDGTRIEGGAAASQAMIVKSTTDAPAAAEAAAGAAASPSGTGGRRRGGGGAVTLPIVVRRSASGKPTTMRSCTGTVGSKKHLPLPGNIVKALPPAQRSGSSPVDVIVAYMAAAPEAAAPEAAAPEAAAPEAAATSATGDAVAAEERLSCFVGPTGSHGCTALQVQVGPQMNGRRLLHIALRTDLTIELGLGEVVDPDMAPQGRRRTSAAMAASAAALAVAEDDDVKEAEAAEERDVMNEMSSLGAKRPRGVAAAAAAAADATESEAALKRRRSSSISPCETTAIADAAAAVAVASAAPPPPAVGYASAAVPLLGFGLGLCPVEGADQSDSSGSGNGGGDGGDGGDDRAGKCGSGGVFDLSRGLEQFYALAVARARGANPLPPQPLPLPQQQLQRQQLQVPRGILQQQLPPRQRRPHFDPPPRPLVPGSGYPIQPTRYGAPPSPLPPHHQPTPIHPQQPVAAYGMLPYPQAVVAGWPAVETGPVGPMRRMAPYGRPVIDPYGRRVRQVYYNPVPPAYAEDAVAALGGGNAGSASAGTGGPASAGAAVFAASSIGVAHKRLDRAAAAAALGQAWGLLQQQLPRAQAAAFRALTTATTQICGGGGSDAIRGFRAHMVGIQELLWRASEVVGADPAVPYSDGSGGNEALRNGLLTAAPAVLNAAECLLEWYDLLAAAMDARTAVSYATELVGSAALVRSQLAQELAPLMAAASVSVRS